MHGRQQLKWPESLKRTSIRSQWFDRICSLRTGLNLAEAAKALREPYGAVRRWAMLFGYQFPDRRRTVSPEQWAGVNWNLRDAEIARQLGVTRECVRLVRRAKGIGPSAAMTAIDELHRFVNKHRDQLHGLLVEDAMHHSGTDLPYHVVRRVLRDASVRPHEPHSPLRQIDWRLPNRDLAAIWVASPRYIANLRARLDVGPSRWNARRRSIARNNDYLTALARERQRAQISRRRDKLREAAPATTPRAAVPV
jgi:hypothetical protein